MHQHCTYVSSQRNSCTFWPKYWVIFYRPHIMGIFTLYNFNKLHTWLLILRIEIIIAQYDDLCTLCLYAPLLLHPSQHTCTSTIPFPVPSVCFTLWMAGFCPSTKSRDRTSSIVCVRTIIKPFVLPPFAKEAQRKIMSFTFWK